MMHEIKSESALLACGHTRLLQNGHQRLMFEDKNKKIRFRFLAMTFSDFISHHVLLSGACGCYGCATSKCPFLTWTQRSIGSVSFFHCQILGGFTFKDFQLPPPPLNVHLFVVSFEHLFLMLSHNLISIIMFLKQENLCVNKVTHPAAHVCKLVCF